MATRSPPPAASGSAAVIARELGSEGELRGPAGEARLGRLSWGALVGLALIIAVAAVAWRKRSR